MADNAPTGPLEMGAEMDYAEHERTFTLFVGLAKYSALACAALLAAMAFGFFVGGFFSATILFILLFVVGAWLLR